MLETQKSGNETSLGEIFLNIRNTQVRNGTGPDVQRSKHPSIYSDDSLIRTRLFPLEISGLTSFPDYWISQVRTLANL